MPPLLLDAEPEGPGPIPGISLQGLRLHLRRNDRPTRAGGENIAKKKQDPFEDEVRQTVREEVKKKIDEGTLTPPKRPKQLDLNMKEVPEVTREKEERAPLNVFRAARFVIKLTDEALENTLHIKEMQSMTEKEKELKRWVQGRVRIEGNEPVLIGEYDYAVEALWNDFKEML